MGAGQQALLIGGGDPFYNNVVFLSHYDGTDTSTTIVDEKGHAVTCVGNAQLDTAQQKFGPSSLLLDGTGDYTTTPDSADWVFTASNFTIEGWVRFAAITGNHVFCSQYENTTNQRAFFLRRTTGNLLTLSIFRNTGVSNSTADTAEGSWTPVIDTWYHIAATWDGSNTRVFADGVLIGSNNPSTGPINSNQPLIFGAVNSSGFTQFMNGWLDDWRLTKGVARYTANFTPPAQPFPNS